MRKRKLLAFLITIAMMVTLIPNAVFSDNAKDNLLVVLPGTIQGALGGANWAPADTETKMTPLGNGKYEFIGIFPKGAYEYKVAIGGSWDENYGKNGAAGGDNISLNVPANDTQVRFVFDYNTKKVQDSINDKIKSFKVPQAVNVIGLGNLKPELQPEGDGDIYKVTVKVPKGDYKYSVQYDGSDKNTFGLKGVRNGEGISLSLASDTDVTFVHNLSNGVTYDSVNYISVADNEKPTITCDGIKSIVMNDDDKDNIYVGSVDIPSGKKDYNFQIKMGDKVIKSQEINFNEVVSSYKINFTYNNKTKEVTNDYCEKLQSLDNNVDARSLYFDSRDLNYKTPFGAVTQGTEVTYRLSAKANDLEKARLVIETHKTVGNQDKEIYEDMTKYPMKKVGTSKDGSREYWEVKVKLNNINVYSYYFEAQDGTSTVIYGNNNQVVPVPHTRVIGTGGVGKYYSIDDDKFIKYNQTVYDKNFKTPDWAKDTIYYYIFPERFKNGDKSNDPKVGVRKFHGTKDIEFHDNWLDKPYVPSDGKSDKEYCNDFFGGDLAGVKQKLDYLKQLGISTIYFNPLFQADSNHKYDTADYMHIDQEFGTNDEFADLCKVAKEKGIKIILDTSLNHSGSASVYMDKFGTYDTHGALKGGKIDKTSPYYSWYNFHPDAKNVDSMYDQWSDPTLATLNEVDSYKDFAFRNDDSVTKYWLKEGASGWRMDVAPWKSDEFWREWRREVKSQDPNALTVCETWFDSSKYFLGDTFDSTMNYIFRTAVMDYANGGSGKDSMAALEMMRENYPKEAFYTLMNLLSTHDVGRTLYYYGYTGDNDSKDVINTAKSKLVLSALIQMTYPGAPAIYYGDEVGVTGGEDPFNRGTYPWKEDGGSPDTALLAKYEQLTKLRNQNPILRRGDITPLYTDDNAMVMLRTYQGKAAIVAVNNSSSDKKVTLDLSKVSGVKNFTDALNGGSIKYAKNLTLNLPAYYGKVLISK